MGKGEGTGGQRAPMMLGADAAELPSRDTQKAWRETMMVRSCPLKFDSYPDKLREMTLEALRLVAHADPAPPEEPEQPLFEVVPASTPFAHQWRNTKTGELGPDTTLEEAQTQAEHFNRFPSDVNAFDPPPTAPKILGLFGFPQTGKDVSADFAEANYRGVRRFAFSDSIIEEANEFLAPYGHKITLNNKNADHYRKLLQAWGMGRRHEDPLYWDKQVRRKVRELQADPNVTQIIITGGRIPEDPETGEINLRDLELIKDIGGKVWKVNRPGNTYTAAAEHPVERGLGKVPDDMFDEVVLNVVEGDFDAYQENISALMNGRPQVWTEPMTKEQADQVRAQRQQLDEQPALS